MSGREEKIYRVTHIRANVNAKSDAGAPRRSRRKTMQYCTFCSLIARLAGTSFICREGSPLTVPNFGSLYESCESHDGTPESGPSHRTDVFGYLEA